MANPYSGGGNATTGGGSGAWSTSTTNTSSIGGLTLTGLNIFTHSYIVSKTDLQNIFNYLWNIWTSLERTFTNANEGIISLIAIPMAQSKLSSSSIGNYTSYTITSGIDTLPGSGLLVEKTVAVSMGTVTIDEYSGSFLDYDENTQISLYLPYIGTVELDPQLVMNKTLKLYYNIDLFTGNCVANVFVAPIGGSSSSYTLMYSFSGNCAYQIPLSSSNYSEMLLTAIGMVAKLIAAVV